MKHTLVSTAGWPLTKVTNSLFLKHIPLKKKKNFFYILIQVLHGWFQLVLWNV